VSLPWLHYELLQLQGELISSRVSLHGSNVILYRLAKPSSLQGEPPWLWVELLVSISIEAQKFGIPNM
jgi:hypothetical protein